MVTGWIPQQQREWGQHVKVSAELTNVRPQCRGLTSTVQGLLTREASARQKEPKGETRTHEERRGGGRDESKEGQAMQGLTAWKGKGDQGGEQEEEMERPPWLAGQQQRGGRAMTKTES